MKIICKWIYKSKKPGIQTPQLEGKQRNIDNMNEHEVYDMITTLLAQNETVRIIFEKENN